MVATDTEVRIMQRLCVSKNHPTRLTTWARRNGEQTAMELLQEAQLRNFVLTSLVKRSLTAPTNKLPAICLFCLPLPLLFPSNQGSINMRSPRRLVGLQRALCTVTRSAMGRNWRYTMIVSLRFWTHDRFWIGF